MAPGHNEAGLHRTTHHAGVDKGSLLCTHPSAQRGRLRGSRRHASVSTARRRQQGVMESSSMEMLASSTKLSFWNSMPTKGAWPRCMKSVLFLRIRREPDIRQGWAVGQGSRGEAGGGTGWRRRCVWWCYLRRSCTARSSCPRTNRMCPLRHFWIRQLPSPPPPPRRESRPNLPRGQQLAEGAVCRTHGIAGVA